MRKTGADMSHLWDPPDPDHGRNVSRRGRSNRSVGIVLLVLAALVAGGAVAYVLSQWQDSRSGAAALPTVAPTTSTTTPSTTSTTTIPPTTTTSTTTVVPTTVPVKVVGDHMVFADGYPLGVVSPAGFASYQGDPVPQLRQGPAQMYGVTNFVGSQFSVQVRPLAPEEMSPTCPITVQPRAADNADPLGLWVESPNWQLMPQTTVTPVLPNDPAVLAVVQLVIASAGVQPAPPAQRGSAVMVDLIGDGIPDLVVSADYSDDSIYYRLVAVAPDGNPDAASAVMLEAGPTFGADGSRDPQSRGELRVDGVVEMNGVAPFELFVRRTTANTKGVSIRDLSGNELASSTCPR
ncbi:MAG TPA: hypothetical protein VHQ23_01725 [Ilumatobacteraceae bacterium]|nr:hypothetical protein [Ilumatobacteraceae bacterium]